MCKHISLQWVFSGAGFSHIICQVHCAIWSFRGSRGHRKKWILTILGKSNYTHRNLVTIRATLKELYHKNKLGNGHKNCRYIRTIGRNVFSIVSILHGSLWNVLWLCSMVTWQVLYCLTITHNYVRNCGHAIPANLVLNTPENSERNQYNVLKDLPKDHRNNLKTHQP